MSEAVLQRRPSDPRVSLGVPELDEMLDGGLMPHRPYLIVGPAGTGKTTLALQFLCEGIRRGERCLYVTVEDPPNEVVWNHRALRPDLDAVDVFDAIPDVMRYERAPFKDISAVREVLPFAKIPETIRQTPEFTSVEVTGTALEQMLRSEVQKRGYARLVIDSLTALQYFCMKGFDPIVGAQTFLRFLTDLRTTTLLTVESALEDVETPERMLARGEIRLFRWELEGLTVRAVGVEKLRGSAHDVRLHPYRIGSKGIDVQLAQTISRDTRRVVEPALTVSLRGEPPPIPIAEAIPVAVVVAPEPLSHQVSDLVALGVDVGPLRGEVEAALAAVRASRLEEVTARLARISAMAISLAPVEAPRPGAGVPPSATAAAAFQRVTARADRIREGKPPTQLPPLDVLAHELARVLELVPAPPVAPPPAAVAPRPAPPAPEVAPVAPPSAAPFHAVPVPEPSAGTAAPPRGAPAARPVVEPPPREPASTPSEVPRAVGRSGSRRPPHHVTRPATASVPPSEPPPLPTVLKLPGSSPAPSAPERSAPAAAEAPPAPAAAPRRRRRAATPKAAAGPSPVEASAAPPEVKSPSSSVAKPRKRVVRRKKAPPVVSAAAEAAPTEPPPAATAPPSPAPDGASAPTEGA